MMMMQNAQMHQMVMQQMMLSAIPKNNSLPPIGSTTEAQVRHHDSDFMKWLQIPVTCSLYRYLIVSLLLFFLWGHWYPCFSTLVSWDSKSLWIPMLGHLVTSKCRSLDKFTTCVTLYQMNIQKFRVNRRTIQFHYVGDFSEHLTSVHTDLLLISYTGKNVLNPFFTHNYCSLGSQCECTLKVYE